VKRINGGFLVRRGWRKPATYEKVLANELKIGLPYGRVANIRKMRFWETETLAKRVLVAASMGGPVHISLEDLEGLR
jgi:hypothetical protein